MSDGERTPQEANEGRDAKESSERQILDDSTLDPRASIEQTGDIHQAEQLQQNLSNLVENTWITPEGEEGHPPEPPDLNHNPFPEETLADTGRDSIVENMPKVRGDLDQATLSSGEPSGEQATPINLPGPEASEARGTPGKPLKEAQFEKPILNQEMEGLDSGLDKLDDLDSHIPGEGSIEGAWKGETLEGDALEGLPSFEGGPADLINDAGSETGGPGAGVGNEIPGWDGPFLPGKGPNAGVEAEEGGSSKPKTPSQGSQGGQQGNQGGEQSQENTNTGADVNIKATFYTAEAVRRLELAAMDAANRHDYATFGALSDTLNNLYDNNPNPGADGGIIWHSGGNKDSTDPETGSGKDPNIPLGQQMEGERLNPKFDQDQISNYPEDHIDGSQVAGKPLTTEQAEKLKRTLENKAKVSQIKPRVKFEQITDPPEPAPKKSSETTGKSE